MFWFSRYGEHTGIRKGVYNEQESLITLAERTGEKGRGISDADILNLIMKYGISFLLENESDKPIPEKELADLMRSIGERKDFRDTATTLHLELSRYPLSMLFDLPKTLALAKEILKTPVMEFEESGHIGYDLGSGTGILLFLQALRARKNGIPIVGNVGIERDHSAQKKGNRLLQSLESGKMVLGNTTKFQYREAPTYITNENIPARGIPFERVNKSEPFFQNIQNLIRQFPHIFGSCHHFPKSLTCIWMTQHGVASTMLVNSMNNYGAVAIFSGDHEKPLSHISANTIEMDGRQIPLDDLGKKIKLVRPTKIRRW
ncbi:hypothetical protein KBC86_01440 [Candidatus Gracilibacteria bacterium]|nr:hypothetical protein [Candidatus Gracilibacteria bacterium]